MLYMNAAKLYVVATPIGNLADMSLRAIEILKQVDVIAAEDTRHSKKLLQHYAITTPLLSLYAENEAQRSVELLARLQRGEAVALISDAGTPLVSDPGQRLVQQAQTAGIDIVPVPGACAAIAALSVAGLPADQFIFVGFLPTRRGARCGVLEGFEHEPRTVVCYEAPHRIMALLADMENVLGAERRVVVARELTKRFETILHGPIADVKAALLADSVQQKGEFVVLLAGAVPQPAADLSESAQHIMTVLAKALPLKQAAQLTAEISGASKNKLYQWAVQKPEIRGQNPEGLVRWR